MLNGFLELISVLTGFISLILAAFLFAAQTQRKLPNQLFGAFLILTAIDVSGWFILGGEWAASWFEAFRSTLGTLQMPLFLGFIASTCYADFKITKWDGLHAVPFLIGLYLSAAGNQLFWGEHGSVLQTVYITQSEATIQLIVSHIQYYLYIAVCVYILWKFRKGFQQHFADSRSDILIWLTQLVAVSIFAHTLLLIRHIAALGDAENLFQVLQGVGAVIVLAVVVWVTFKALMKPELFRGVDRTLLEASSRLSTIGAEQTKGNHDQKNLLAYMDTNRPYLNPELTLHSLADQLALTPRELSELINGTLGVHFFDFVNGYRIKAAKEILREERTKTILDVLHQVGFNSKSSFNTAFKKHVQMTPTAYRRASHVKGVEPAQ